MSLQKKKKEMSLLQLTSKVFLKLPGQQHLFCLDRQVHTNHETAPRRTLCSFPWSIFEHRRISLEADRPSLQEVQEVTSREGSRIGHTWLREPPVREQPGEAAGMHWRKGKGMQTDVSGLQ